MVLALWMERCPSEGGDEPGQPRRAKADDPNDFGVHNAGAVFVDANERIVAMDYTR